MNGLSAARHSTVFRKFKYTFWGFCEISCAHAVSSLTSSWCIQSTRMPSILCPALSVYLSNLVSWVPSDAPCSHLDAVQHLPITVFVSLYFTSSFCDLNTLKILILPVGILTDSSATNGHVFFVGKCDILWISYIFVPLCLEIRSSQAWFSVHQLSAELFTVRFVSSCLPFVQE